MTTIERPDTGAPQVNPAADSPANKTENFASRPMTGDEYIESLRDGREIWLHGERVKDVTTHPAFRNPIRMTARLYDSMHDPATKDKVTTATPATGASPCPSSRLRPAPTISSRNATRSPSGRG